MNRKLTSGVMMIFLAALLTPLPARADATDWTTRGKNADRSQTTSQALGPVTAVPAWSVPPDVGASGSQPLFVGDSIYHLADNALWGISPTGQAQPLADRINVLNDTGGFRPSTSGITYVQTADGSALYFGTGNNRLCVVSLPPGRYRCVNLTSATSGEEPIVTVPLVYQVELPSGRTTDLVVMGDKRGRVWVVQDLLYGATPQDKKTTYAEVGGWVLASPVAVGSPTDLTFVWGNDKGSVGAIGAYRIIPADGTLELALQPVWTKVGGYVKTYAGIADGFAKDGDLVYAADKAGNFYEIDTLWQSVRENRYSATAGPMFANASPAVDADHVYYVIRNVGTRNPSPDHHGRLVALDRQNFQVKWTADLPAPANTNPLVWAAGPNVVLVGDTKGSIHAFDRTTGAPAPFAVHTQTAGDQTSCTPIQSLKVGSASQAGQYYQNTTGITDPILASGNTPTGLLLFGLSGKNDQGQLTGQLHAYATGGAYNLRWETPSLAAAEVIVGQPHQVAGNLVLDPWGLVPAGQPRTFTVQGYWVSSQGPARLIWEGDLTLTPGQPQPLTIPFTPTEADGETGTVKLFANPQGLLVAGGEPGQEYRAAFYGARGLSADEIAGVNRQADRGWEFGQAMPNSGSLLPGQCAGAELELLASEAGSPYADNLLQQPLTIRNQIDLAVTALTVPKRLPCESAASYPVAYTLHNSADRTIRAVHRIRVKGDAQDTWYTLKQQVADLAPGDNHFAVNLSATRCGEGNAVEVWVNPDKTVTETTYANNAMYGLVVVEGQEQDWHLSDGGRQVLIVPADCQSNPDPTSDYPCTNYPNLVIPR